MKNSEICRLIRCPYYSFFECLGMYGRCYEIGSCIRIKDQQRRWKLFPMTRPGISFTDEEKEKIRILVDDANMLEAQKMILDRLEEEEGCV